MPNFIQVNRMFGFDSVNRLPRTSHDQWTFLSNEMFNFRMVNVGDHHGIVTFAKAIFSTTTFITLQCRQYDNSIPLTFRSNNKLIFFLFHLFYLKKGSAEREKKINKFDVVYLLFIGQVLSIGF